jgi:ribose transport system ATP-binding protein
VISWSEARRAAADALATMGCDLDPSTPVTSLPAAERSLVAIGRALAVKSDILVLDEPTAALPGADVERLLETLRRLRDSGMGIIYVTHRLDEVFRIADRITVLRDGRRVATVDARETSSAALVEMIVGRSMNDAFVRPAPASDRTVLTVDRAVAEQVGPVSFTVAAGETLGLVGLRGAGHHTIGRAIFGQIPLEGGHISIDGRRTDPAGPADAIRNQIGFVSSRRAEESIAANMAVRENIYLNPAVTGKDVMEIVGRHGEREVARAALRKFSIKAEDTEQPVATLSGGNQQKVVVARWMEANVRVLVLEEPTIGVDVSSKAEIYHLLQLSLKKGMAVLLISSDFEEVERICHRALVFSRGHVVAEIPHSELTIANLTASASGGTAATHPGSEAGAHV